MNNKNRRYGLTFSLSRADIDFLDVVAEDRFNGNRSAALEHYLKLGKGMEEMAGKQHEPHGRDTKDGDAAQG